MMLDKLENVGNKRGKRFITMSAIKKASITMSFFNYHFYSTNNRYPDL